AAESLWACDPMHGNTELSGARKTRRFEHILGELARTCDVHAAEGTRLGGAHLEITHQDVTECLGGASGVTETDLTRNYVTACDPRLNYEQALELAFTLGERIAAA
ncbi:MAG TPA: 3-deoxy-7-phosphoheptulonate synthase, partial [Phycisphaerales bacterium]|nr:3-deoxy-7-phosphoheptulonate synthase [Phycisphaerales bacterium]